MIISNFKFFTVYSLTDIQTDIQTDNFTLVYRNKDNCKQPVSLIFENSMLLYSVVLFLW